MTMLIIAFLLGAILASLAGLGAVACGLTGLVLGWALATVLPWWIVLGVAFAGVLATTVACEQLFRLRLGRTLGRYGQG
jgi:hypothetical protein